MSNLNKKLQHAIQLFVVMSFVVCYGQQASKQKLDVAEELKEVQPFATSADLEAAKAEQAKQKREEDTFNALSKSGLVSKPASDQEKTTQKSQSPLGTTVKTFLQKIQDFLKPKSSSESKGMAEKAMEALRQSEQDRLGKKVAETNEISAEIPKPWQQKPTATQMRAAFGKYVEGEDVVPVPLQPKSIDEMRAEQRARQEEDDKFTAAVKQAELDRLEKEQEKAPARPKLSVEQTLTEKQTAAKAALDAIPVETKKAERSKLLGELAKEANARKIRPQDVLVANFMKDAVAAKSRLDVKIPRGAPGERDEEAYRIADKKVGEVKDIVEKWSLEKINYVHDIRTLESVGKKEEAATIRAAMEREEKARLAMINKIEAETPGLKSTSGEQKSVLQLGNQQSTVKEEEPKGVFQVSQ